MRSGYFDKGKQVGEWTTYDGKGKVYKVTKMKLPQIKAPGKTGGYNHRTIITITLIISWRSAAST